MKSRVQGLVDKFIRPKVKDGIVGIWLSEEAIIHAARKTREAGFKKFDAITPFPVHGIDDALGYEFSNIPWITFVAGLIGALAGLLLTWYTSVHDYPVVIGGKPYWAIASFIPIIFELTILFAALSSVGALLYVCGLPKVDPPILDPDLTSHKFALFVPVDDSGFDEKKVTELFKSLGADETRKAVF